MGGLNRCPKSKDMMHHQSHVWQQEQEHSRGPPSSSSRQRGEEAVIPPSQQPPVKEVAGSEKRMRGEGEKKENHALVSDADYIMLAAKTHYLCTEYANHRQS